MFVPPLSANRSVFPADDVKQWRRRQIDGDEDRVARMVTCFAGGPGDCRGSGNRGRDIR